MRYVFITERPLAGDSRVIRSEVRINSESHAQRLVMLVCLGDLPLRHGVRAWVEYRND